MTFRITFSMSFRISIVFAQAILVQAILAQDLCCMRA